MGVPGRHNREVQQGEEDVVRRAAAVGKGGVREGGEGSEDRRGVKDGPEVQEQEFKPLRAGKEGLICGHEEAEQKRGWRGDEDRS